MEKTTFQNWLESLNMLQEDIASKAGISQGQVSYDKKNKTGCEPIIKYAKKMKLKGVVEVSGVDYGKKVKLTITL